jgi:hypothetical protein
MIIERLHKQPTEDNLTDTIAEVFKQYPEMVDQFMRTFASTEEPILPKAIHCRWRLNSIFPEANLSAPLGNRCPDLICIAQGSIVLIESKKGAGFTDNQLEDYQSAVDQVRGERKAFYFLLAPKSTIYERYPKDYRVVAWDDVFDMFHRHPHLRSYSDKLETFRLEQYRTILDKLVERLHSKLARHPEKFSANKYHGYHMELPYSSSMLFALSIYLTAPRYAKLFPFWLLDRATKMTQSSHPFVAEYRGRLEALPRTIHDLEKKCPGYVIDLFPSPGNGLDTLFKEVESLIDVECKQMTQIYDSIAPKYM